METTTEYSLCFSQDVLTHIFGFLDPRTLVFSCRLVCRFWKYTAESAGVWRTLISRYHRSKYILRISLKKAHLVCPWYMCYALCRPHVFGDNLLTNSAGKVAGKLKYWDMLNYTKGFIFTETVEPSPMGFKPFPQELLDAGIATCFTSPIGDCNLSRTVDLYAIGFTRKIMELRPSVHVSNWFVVANSFTGVCQLEVTFLNSKWREDYDNGRFLYETRIQRGEWHKVEHTFRNYSPDVRYVVFDQGLNTVTWLTDADGTRRDHGESAAKMAGAKLVITLPELTDNSVSGS